MSSRLGPICLTIGVLLIGIATLMTAISGTPAAGVARPQPVVLSTGFAIWLALGALGLLAGLIASRHTHQSLASDQEPSWFATPVGNPAAAQRAGAVLEPVEHSA